MFCLRLAGRRPDGAKSMITIQVGTDSAFLVARSNRTGRTYVGIVTEDGRVRVDLLPGDELGDLVFREAEWIDPADPHRGGRVLPVRVIGLRPDVT